MATPSSDSSGGVKKEKTKETIAALARVAGLPSGWDVRVTADCKVYYVDHSNRATQWRHPVDKVRRTIQRELPAGWRKDRDSDGHRVYAHENGEKMYMDPRLVVLFDEPRVQFPSGSESSRPQGRRTRRSRGNSRERSPLERKAPNGDVPTQAGESSQDKPTAGVVIPSTASVSSLDESDSDDSGFETTSSTSSQCDKATSSSTPSHPFDRNSTGMNVAAVTCPAQFGKCAVVTGANSGIGFETAKCLAMNGIHVVMACRSVGSASDAADRIRYLKDGCRIDVMELDLASLESVHQFARKFKQCGWPLHMLICCASVMAVPYAESSDGVEMHFAVNHLGHFCLVKLLTPVLRRSSPSRVVVLTSELHKLSSFSGGSIDFDQDIPMSKNSYQPILAYNRSKLCNLLFVKELQRRLRSDNVKCFAVHPGMAFTGLIRHSWMVKAAYYMLWPFTRTVEQAAAGVVFCATHSDMPGDGFYFSDCQELQPASEAQDGQLAEHLWKLSEVLCNTTGFANFTQPWRKP